MDSVSKIPHSVKSIKAAPLLSIPDFSRDVVLVDDGLLQEHVQTPLVLRQRVACHLVDETFQSFPSLFDKILFKNSVVLNGMNLDAVKQATSTQIELLPALYFK